MSSPPHPAAALASAAARYCAWLERMPVRATADTDQALATREAQEMRRLFAEVYARALEVAELPGTEIDPSNLVEPRRWTPDDLPGATARLRALPFSCYRDVYDGQVLGEDSPAPIGDLCDDALDVWVHLRGPLDVWNEGHHDAAAWHWRLHFEAELGPHLVHGTYELHDFLTSRGPKPAQGFEPTPTPKVAAARTPKPVLGPRKADVASPDEL